MAHSLAEIAAEAWGDDDGWTAPGSHGPLADDARKALVAALRDIAVNAKFLEALVRAEPDDDEIFAVYNQALAAAWSNADAAYARFRNLRECAGEG